MGAWSLSQCCYSPPNPVVPAPCIEWLHSAALDFALSCLRTTRIIRASTKFCGKASQAETSQLLCGCLVTPSGVLELDMAGVNGLGAFAAVGDQTLHSTPWHPMSLSKFM